MSDDISLKEFMNLRFQQLEKKMDDLRDFIEGQTSDLAKRVDGLERWKLTTESQLKVYRAIGALLVSVVVALVIAWARQRLGI